MSWSGGSRVFRSSFPQIELQDSSFRTNVWRFGVARRAEDLKPLVPTMLHAFATAAKLERDKGIRLIPDREGDPEEVRSYHDLYLATVAIAERLRGYGVKKGDRVLIVLPTSLEFVTSFFAAQLLGAIAVPAYPPFGLKLEAALGRLVHVAAHAGAEVCLTNRQIRPVLGSLALEVPTLRHLLVVEDLAGGRIDQQDYRARGDDPAMIQYTSGSTGNPKGVLLTHRSLVSNIHAIGQALRIKRDDVAVSWCPLYHDMGLIGTLLFSIYWRVPLVLMSPVAFLGRPIRWLRAISDHRGTLSTAPNFAYALCVRRVKPEEREGLDLSSWRMALNGAEQVNHRTIVDFERTYAPHGFKRTAMLPVYGLAEATLAVSFPAPGSVPRHETVDRVELAQGTAIPTTGDHALTLVSVGQPVPGHEVAIVDEAGNPLPERQVGHIVVRGPSLMSGYFRDAAASEAILRDGALWTGDLGYVSEGNLYVTGRAKDIIIVRGRNYYAEDLERHAERVEGVRAGTAVAFGVYDEEKAADLVVIVTETRSEDAAERTSIAQRVSAHVTEECGLAVDEVVVVDAGVLPKTSSGKKQRSRVRELYLSDELTGRSAGTGTVGKALVYARSGAGHLLLTARRLLGKRSAPE